MTKSEVPRSGLCSLTSDFDIRHSIFDIRFFFSAPLYFATYAPINVPFFGYRISTAPLDAVKE